MSPTSQAPTSEDAGRSIIHSLLCHRQGGESESFAKRAIESLVKKLKEKKDELNSLVTAITTNGAYPSKCVTIQRTLDGRLQIAGRKGFPHLTYARIWRWPNLQKNELKPASFCHFAFDLMEDRICINPYHYERVISTGIDLSGLHLHQAGLPAHLANDKFSRSSSRSIPEKAHLTGETETVQHPPINFLHLPCTNEMSRSLDVPTPPDHFIQLLQTNSEDQSQVTMASEYFQPVCNQVNLQYYPQATVLDAVSQWPDSSTSNFSQIMSHFPTHWCTLNYYELDQQVGETFKVPYHMSTVTVDGYTYPFTTARFCLGHLTNLKRTEVSERARLHIGKGIKIHCKGEGDVWIHCLSDHSVFIKSFYLDGLADRAPGEVVHKIFPTVYIKVFDIRQCYKQMKEIIAVEQAAEAEAVAVSIAGSSAVGATANLSAGVAVDSLRQLCVIQLSFIKGWGPDYCRKSIKESPCWIEIRLHSPLQLLDELLKNQNNDSWCSSGQPSTAVCHTAKLCQRLGA